MPVPESLVDQSQSANTEVELYCPYFNEERQEWAQDGLGTKIHAFGASFAWPTT